MLDIEAKAEMIVELKAENEELKRQLAAAGLNAASRTEKLLLQEENARLKKELEASFGQDEAYRARLEKMRLELENKVPAGDPEMERKLNE
jgi:hypothetical protein